LKEKDEKYQKEIKIKKKELPVVLIPQLPVTEVKISNFIGKQTCKISR